MFDFSDVTAFALKLADAADTSDIEKEWKREESKTLADAIDPPVATGALAASVRATDEGVEMLDYWVYPEYGTSRMGPRPFVRPAIKQRGEPAAEKIGELVLRELL